VIVPSSAWIGVKLIDESPPENGGTFDPGRSRGDLELRNVTLRYRDDQPPDK